MDLNHTRLPIPPYPQIVVIITWDFEKCNSFLRKIFEVIFLKKLKKGIDRGEKMW